MKKPELLSPAGNMEALKAAIHNGADAVYISGKKFGARKFAQNFDFKELIEAINYAHLYDVKVYVTVNTIIYESEVEECLNYLNFLYERGVDAVIMQDMGMISLTIKNIPGLEIHVSTQANTCNDEALQLYKSMGIKRVVLARELSLDDINNLQTKIDKEIFIHGALCVCYSGCCLLSSFEGGRSGNRGECAGPCRLPYQLIKKKNQIKDWSYLLSTKELNTSKQITRILDSNVQSLKIEGRMKSPEYVGFVTKMYRELIDNHYTKNSENDLKKLFNREFTEGYLFNQKNEELMNPKTPNHVGIAVGKVLDVNKKIKIKLTDELSQNDGIRFAESHKGMIINRLYNAQGLLINKAKKNEIVFVDNKINLKTLDHVRKTTDYQLINQLKNYQMKKIPVTFEVRAFIDEPLTITIDDGKRKIKQNGNLISQARTMATTNENIYNQLSKLGNTPFICENIYINGDKNIFISLRELNEIRRKLIENLTNERIKINRQKNKIELTYAPQITDSKITLSALVSNEKQLQAIIDKVDNIYVDDYQLYKKYRSNKIFFKLNRTAKKLGNLHGENLLLSELGGVYKYSKDNYCYSDYTLNVVNGYTTDFLAAHNIKKVTISPETSIEQIRELVSHNNNIEVIIYGTIELMVINQQMVGNDDQYFLRNKRNELFPIINKNNQTYIMLPRKINLFDQISTLKDMGIRNFRIDFFDEDPEEILSILNKIKDLRY